MSAKDSMAKEYFADNARFADLCNNILYGGREVILPEKLKERDTTEVLTALGLDKKTIAVQKLRDIFKNASIKYTGKSYVVLIGVENQSDIHYSIPVKNMFYDVMAYGNQVKETAKKHRREKDIATSDEFLSGFTKEDKLIPVITITVYLGIKEWDGPRKLSDMFGDVDEELLPFIPDYRINLLAPREITDFTRFRTSIRQLFEVLKNAYDKEKMQEVLQNDEKFSKVDRETVEAINHAKTAGVSIIVAVNKIDKPSAQPERVLQQLTEYDLVPEAWGGTTPVVYVSAKTGEGVNELLETILLVSDILELKANPNRSAKGSIIEAKLDKGKGPLATVLVQNGTLHVGDFVVAGTCTGKIRGMIDDKGKNVKSAGPSVPVSVLGFSEVPNAGDPITVVQDEKFAKQVVSERIMKLRNEMNNMKASTSLDDIFAQIKKGETKTLNIIIKADVQGSVEAVKQSLEKLSNDEVKISVIHGAVGAVNESDVMLASTSGAIIIGFNVRPDAKAKASAERSNIDIRLYRVIYDAIDDVNAAIKGMLAPKFRENILGNAEVRQVYRITGAGTIAGCYVTDGKIVRNAKVRLYRDNTLVYEGELSSLKRFKDDVKEVARGYECGMGIQNFNDIKEGDVIEAYVMEQINE